MGFKKDNHFSKNPNAYSFTKIESKKKRKGNNLIPIFFLGVEELSRPYFYQSVCY